MNLRNSAALTDFAPISAFSSRTIFDRKSLKRKVMQSVPFGIWSWSDNLSKSFSIAWCCNPPDAFPWLLVIHVFSWNFGRHHSFYICHSLVIEESSRCRCPSFSNTISRLGQLLNTISSMDLRHLISNPFKLPTLNYTLDAWADRLLFNIAGTHY